MNVAIARERLNEVLRVDSINSTNADFMATHVPFRSICVQRNMQSAEREHLSEEEIYSQFFAERDVYDRHQFIIVEGASGSGKSHFIRWLNAKLQPFVEGGSDVVLLLRRSDNTLKGTIRQLLSLDAVQGIRNRDAYERLVRANQTISETKFKEKIYAEFIVEINTSEDNDRLSKVQKKQLVALLNNDLFKNRMMAFDGPIDRIYQKVAGTSDHQIHSEDALFHESDFTLDVEFNRKMNQTADKYAQRIADRLIPSDDGESFAGEVMAFMNSFVDRVVQSCAGIEEGDFQAIFKEIRQELRSKNKNLILLIEDITACTGINRDLLDALETEHTGLNESDKLCRLISVVGTTTEYYKEFRDNYRDRITAQIKIEDGSIGTNRDDVVVFFAKYLNTMSLSAETVQEWYINGAKEEEYPIHNPDCKWRSKQIGGGSLNLYPFTPQAIQSLYQNMPVQKTPRYILREIIEPAVHEIIVGKGLFPIFLNQWRRPFDEIVEAKIRDAFLTIKYDGDFEQYKRCVLSLIAFWGNGTLDINEKTCTISGIKKSEFEAFGLGGFAEIFLGEVTEPQDAIGDSIDDTGNTDVSIQQKPVKDLVNPKYEELRTSINEWFYNGKLLNKAREIRDALCAFVFDALNWQQLGVSVEVRDLVKNDSINLFSIERQDRANARGLIELKATEETRDVLLAIGKYLYIGNKKWNFTGAAEAIFTLTCWLEGHKQELLDAVVEKEVGVPTYIRCALLSDIIYLTLYGQGIKKLSDFTSDKVFMKYPIFQANLDCHSIEWQNLALICKNDNAAIINHNFVLDYFNLVQGSGVSKYFMSRFSLNVALSLLNKQKYLFDFSQMKEMQISGKKNIKEYCRKLYERLSKVVEQEKFYVEDRIRSLYQYFDYDLDVDIDASDIRSLLTDIVDFYEKVDFYGLTFIKNSSEKAKVLINRSNEIANLLKVLKEIDDESPLLRLMRYSGDSMKILNELLNLCKVAEEDAKRVNDRLEIEKQTLIRSGGWLENVDPRFDEIAQKFAELKDELKEVL